MSESDSVFVRGLLPGINTEELNDVFAEVGPVKSAFIVVDKDGPNKGKSKGYGFVQFALAEDAVLAVEKLQGQSIGGSKMVLQIAEKKGYKHQGGSSISKQKVVVQKETSDEQDDNIFRRLAADATITNAKKAVKGESAARKMEEMLRDCSIVLFNLPKDATTSQVKQKAGKAGKVNMIEMPLQSLELGNASNAALVIYTKKNSASVATAKLSGKVWSQDQPMPVMCRRVKQIATTKKSQSNCRLILRNLAFTVTEDILLETFSPFGPILEIKLSQNQSNDTHKGFAFIQFACRIDANQAIEKINGKNLCSRPVAIDWALNKSDYDRLVNKTKNASEEKPADESRDDFEEKDEMEDEEEEDLDEEMEDEEEEDLDEEMEEESDDNEDFEDDTTAKDNRDKTRLSALEERSRTIFIRNILFETTETELFEEFKKFGGVRYVKIAKMEDGRSKGVGFVNFYKADSYDRALKTALSVPQSSGMSEKSSPGGSGISVGGRPLLVAPAIDRDEAAELVNLDKNKKVDKRHLYLSKEGLVKDDTQVPKTDIKKRERAEVEKKTKLKNPLFFISPVRLSVRNLFRGDEEGNPETGDKELKQLFLKASKQGMLDGVIGDNEGDANLLPKEWPKKKTMNIVIKQAKVQREDVVNDKKTLGRSKGYGFVEFTEHVHALAALRVLNNNPAYAVHAIGGPRSTAVAPKQKSRLIIEFAVENSAKLKARQKGIEKAQLQNMKNNAVKHKPSKAPVEKYLTKDDVSEERKRKRTEEARKPSRKKEKKSKDEPKTAKSPDDVKNLVAQYKQSIFDQSEEKSEKKRWFDI